VTPFFESSLSVVGLNSSHSQFKIILPFLQVYVDATLAHDDVNITSPVDTAFVLFGHQVYESSPQALSGVYGSNYMTSPLISYDFSGRSVSNAGDVNGDGYDDLIIGVPYASRCYVMFGTERGFVNMTEGFTIFGAQSNDLTGWSVSGAGDVNGDNITDIVIGVPYGSYGARSCCGAVYAIYGRKTYHQNIKLDEFDSIDGRVVFGSKAYDSLGISVSSAG
jgi:hypothetical protein